MNPPSALLVFSGLLTLAHPCLGKNVTAQNQDELRAAIKSAKPGTTITLAPGKYRGGITLTRLSGKAGAPVIITGADLKNPPRFTGGTEALHLSDCTYVTLRNLHISGYPGNGINIDDGGSFGTPSHHITVENVTIENTGPKGNHDALKLSGLTDFTIKNCTFRGWAGSAIDMVGCHRGVIEGCTLTGDKEFTESSGIQIKGGTTKIMVRKCFFNRAGQRAINLGGSTGLTYFRPSVTDYEAKDITIAGNRFLGSEAPIAWVTAHGGHVHHNTFVLPDKWVMRILQESKDPRFKPCHGGVFEHNLVVFNKNVRVFANIGPGTDATSFTFRRNAWFELDGSRKPDLPAHESDGIHQPVLKIHGLLTGQMKFSSTDPKLKQVGADAL
ncbi:MAG: right-handed parallel beta-helix repeat-containing protein [Akkermansiaceae bacterium]|nr:right-handed parallel beta-helix repeat-containing protein [Akkermansiaceae bacterium]